MFQFDRVRSLPLKTICIECFLILRGKKSISIEEYLFMQCIWKTTLSKVLLKFIYSKKRRTLFSKPYHQKPERLKKQSRMKSRIWYHLQRRVKRYRSSSLVRLKLSNGPLKENKDRVEKRKAFQTFLLHIVKFFMQNITH